MLTAALIGFLLGFLGSIPVAGPIAALVVARAFQGRFRAGLFISLGAGLAEAAYACLAFFGFSAVVKRYPAVLPLCQGAGAVILAVLGVLLIRRPPVGDVSPGDAPPPRDRFSGGFLLGFSITALNPTFLATWSAAVATLFATGWVDRSPGLAVPFALGVCGGIVAWFGLLLTLLRRARHRFRPALLNRGVQLIGVGLLGLALWLGYQLATWVHQAA